MIRLGLTGGIGSGKSTVASTWAALGATVIDADAISRASTAPGGAAIEPIRQRFGAAFITAEGALDRARMRELAFSDPTARQALEAIIHPLVARETQRLVDGSGAAVIVFDIPLLIESGRWRQRLDRVLVVDCEPDTQVRRTMARNSLSEAQVLAIMAQQVDRATRLAGADAIVYNDGIDLESLASEVRSLASRFGL